MKVYYCTKEILASRYEPVIIQLEKINENRMWFRLLKTTFYS